MSINRTIMVGRPTRDPEMKYTSAGVAVTQFTLAVNRAFKGQDGVEADFFPVVCWRALAENVGEYMKKGRLVGVEGRMQVRSYEDTSGRRVYVTELIADEVRFLDSAGDSGHGGGNTPPADKKSDKGQFWAADDLPFMK